MAEEGIVISDNKEGNPRHKKSDGTFASKEDFFAGLDVDDIYKEIESIKNQEFTSFVDRVGNDLIENKKEQLISLSTDDKKNYLTNFNNDTSGFDVNKINNATEEELNAILIANACLDLKGDILDRICFYETYIKSNFNDVEKDLKESDFNKEVISGIWYGKDVRPSDYEELSKLDANSESRIDKKRKYYNDLVSDLENDLNTLDLDVNTISDYNNKIQKAKKCLDDLNHFEEIGKKYLAERERLKQEQYKNSNKLEEYSNKCNELKNKLNNLGKDYEIKRNDSIIFLEKYQNENAPYSDLRKRKAFEVDESDTKKSYLKTKEMMDDIEKEQWKSLTPTQQKLLKEYTWTFTKINDPLRGIYYNNYATGKSYYNNSFVSQIKELTDALDKCSFPVDMYLYRGINNSPVFNMGGGNKKTLYDFNDEELKSLVGSSFRDTAFQSCGTAKNSGFTDSQVFIRYYCPKGVKAVYLGGVSSYPEENETLLQRGYSAKITKVSKKGSQYFIEADIELGSDEDKYDEAELKQIALKNTAIGK